MEKVVSVLVAGLILAGCVSVIAHDDKKAAKAAERFTTAAFIERDYPKAYDLMSSDAKKHISLAQFQETVMRMHPTAFPSAIKATEFEPMPGQKAMNIFLFGEGGGESFYYRLIMTGTSSSGYQVAGFVRGSGPYPPSKLSLKIDR
jgi:hypothetical protein